MFNADNENSSVATPSIDELPCLVNLPAGWLDQYGHDRAPQENDQRRFPRVGCGASQAKAALEYRTTLPAKPRDAVAWAVYPVSISRGGIAFLHSEPLYPRESFQIRFPDGRSCNIEITRCRRVGDRCFEVGAQF
jgi:hypothetical protein